jgi:hypothetical protein
MKSIAFDPLDQLPPELGQEADRIAAELVGSLNRVRDHLLDPARQKLSSDPLEQKLARSLARLKGRLGREPLRTVPVATARKRLPWPERGATEQQVRAEVEKMFAGDMSLIGQAVPRAIVSRALEINRLTCVQDTLEPGNDEMVIGTVATALRILDDGTITTAVATREVDLGKFRKNDSTAFNPPRPIATFSNVESPIALVVHLVLAESDIAGGVNAVLRDLVDGVENRLNGKKFTALFSSAAALVASYPLAAAIFVGAVSLAELALFLVWIAVVLVLAAVVAALLLAVFRLFRDEIFPTQSLALSLDAAGAVTSGTTGPVTLRFSRQVGVYEAEFEWS